MSQSKCRSYRGHYLSSSTQPHFSIGQACDFARRPNNRIIGPPDAGQNERGFNRDDGECRQFARPVASGPARSGWAMAYVVRDLDAAAAFIDAALMPNPNLSEAWFCGGWVKIWLSEPDAAIERFARAIRLSPLGARITGMRRIGIAHGHFFPAPL